MATQIRRNDRDKIMSQKNEIKETLKKNEDINLEEVESVIEQINDEVKADDILTLKEETFDASNMLDTNDMVDVEETSNIPDTLVVENQTVIEEQKILIEKLQKDKETLERQLTEQAGSFEEQFNKMQGQIDALIKMSNTTKLENLKGEDIAVGCRVFSGLGMCNADGTNTVVFRCGEKKYIDVEDLKMYLKESVRNNKALFANGLLFFYDEANYERFKIRKKVDLSEENVLNILAIKDTNELIRAVAKLTNNLYNENVCYTFKYMIAEMLVRTPDKIKFSYENRTALENYLGIKFDRLIANANMYKFIKMHQ